MNFDEKMMSLALREARKGWGRTSPNPMVGAVAVKNGRVIAKGAHAYCGGPHAEAVALKRAGDGARGAELYVTLEPCNHHGRTPPCSEAILAAGVKRVVIGAMDPNPGVRGGGAEHLASNGVEVATGVLEEKCLELISWFIKHVTTGLPYVIIKSAASMDGKIAASSGHSKWITGEKARAWVHRLRNGVDAILVGGGTVRQDDPSLSTRLPGKRKGHDPVRIVLDGSLSLSPTHRVFDPEIGGRTIIACSVKPNLDKMKQFKDMGVVVWPLPLKKGRVSFKALLARMGKENFISLLVEGGSEINASILMEDRLVDRLYFFYAPKIIGGASAPTLVGGEGVSRMNQALELDIVQTRRFGPDWMVEAVPRYDARKK